MAPENQPYDLAYYGWMMHLAGAGLWRFWESTRSTIIYAKATS